MKLLGWTLHALTVAAILAAIWLPRTWQFALTALVLFLAGAIVLGLEGLRHHGTPQDGARNEQNPASGHQDGPSDSERSQNHTARREYGRKADQ